MGGSTGGIQLGSERKLYKYVISIIMPGQQKKQVHSKIILSIVQMYYIFGLLTGVPDCSSGVIDCLLAFIFLYFVLTSSVGERGCAARPFFCYVSPV